ncbi:hypothetical protein BAW75_00535 [Micromonospora chalcea]|nr:hypothetical protein BAW75_00535 [Micromonospora chalcea]
MLDDMRVLRDAVAEYRAAATAAGLDWPEHAEAPAGQPPGSVYRIFGVDHVAEQLAWFQSQNWPPRRLLPNGGWIMPWPADGGEELDTLAISIGTPFPWRHQVRLFNFEHLVYTFVLAGEYEGEIWRYEFTPDVWGSARAATSLAALFTGWTKGIAAGAVVHDDLNGWLQVREDGQDEVAVLRERVPDVDFLTFPVYVADESLLRARQRECGVDMDCIERGFDCYEELSDTVRATRRSLGI